MDNVTRVICITYEDEYGCKCAKEGYITKDPAGIISITITTDPGIQHGIGTGVENALSNLIDSNYKDELKHQVLKIELKTI